MLKSGTTNTEWGVEKYGAKLSVSDSPLLLSDGPLFIDVEDDEKGNFVGLGYTQDGINIFYRSEITDELKHSLEKLYLIGHNLKYDAKQLVKWGVNIKPEQLLGDTILMSYVMDSTKASHGLKDLGKERKYEWPSYKDIVGSGKSKQTLDKQPLELVTNYNAMDVLVTARLYKEFKLKMNPLQTRILEQIELPLMRILFEMELKGVLIDVDKLKELDGRFRNKLNDLTGDLRRLAAKEFNPNSNNQVAEIIEGRGMVLPRTPKGSKKVDKGTLEKFSKDEFVRQLLEYNKIEKLVSTYTGGFLELGTLPRIFPTYNQISLSTDGAERGISTGRLSCKKPNLQQIPTRTEEGKLLRELFIPEKGKVFIDADYSQIEYRLLAHFTKEPILIKAFMEGKDVHEETGKALGVDRDTGKTLNFASIYGAQAKKIAKTAGVTEEAAKGFIDSYWSKLPRVTSWINQVKHQAKKQGGVYTLMKRWIPLPGLYSNDLWDRYHWERCVVNYIVQGSAAELLKLAMIKLRENGFLASINVHDELLFEVKSDSEAIDTQSGAIKLIMESVVKLDVPIIADVGIGTTWRGAKE